MNWISVEDRLPECGKRVLAVFEYKNGLGRNIFILNIDIPQEGDTWIQSWGNDEISLDPWHGRVTHWAELPNLPKERNRNG